MVQVKAILYQFFPQCCAQNSVNWHTEPQAEYNDQEQWPAAVPEQRGHLQAFASQWRSRSTASGLDLLRKMEPQNILEGLWKKNTIKQSYFSLCFLPSSLLLQCCVTSSVRLSQNSPYAMWGLSHSTSTAMRTLVRNCMSHMKYRSTKATDAKTWHFL